MGEWVQMLIALTFSIVLFHVHAKPSVLRHVLTHPRTPHHASPITPPLITPLPLIFPLSGPRRLPLPRPPLISRHRVSPRPRCHRRCMAARPLRPHRRGVLRHEGASVRTHMRRAIGVFGGRGDARGCQGAGGGGVRGGGGGVQGWGGGGAGEGGVRGEREWVEWQKLAKRRIAAGVAVVGSMTVPTLNWRAPLLPPCICTLSATPHAPSPLSPLTPVSLPR